MGQVGPGVYASENVSAPLLGSGHGYSAGGGGRASGVGILTQTVTATLMLVVQEFIENLRQANWLPWTTADQGSRFIGPDAPRHAWESPVSFVGNQEKITRFGPFPSAERPFPYPWTTGVVSGFWAMQDQYSIGWARARTPYGPSIGTPVPQPWAITYPELRKVTG